MLSYPDQSKDFVGTSHITIYFLDKYSFIWKIGSIFCFLKFLRKIMTGGSVKDGVVIIQGDHRNTLVLELKNQGFKVKVSGG